VASIRVPLQGVAPQGWRTGVIDHCAIADLVERQADIVVEHENGPLVHVQAAEAALQLVTVEQAEVGIGLGNLERGDVDLHRTPAPALACLAMAGVDQQPVQPGVETIRIAEPADVPPGGDERLLDSVLGEGVVTQDQSGDDEEPAGRDRASSANAS
jgi:hypothetical protein